MNFEDLKIGKKKKWNLHLIFQMWLKKPFFFHFITQSKTKGIDALNNEFFILLEHIHSRVMKICFWFLFNVKMSKNQMIYYWCLPSIKKNSIKPKSSVFFNLPEKCFYLSCGYLWFVEFFCKRQCLTFFDTFFESSVSN